jgi:hypothetical protein
MMQRFLDLNPSRGSHLGARSRKWKPDQEVKLRRDRVDNVPSATLARLGFPLNGVSVVISFGPNHR